MGNKCDFCSAPNPTWRYPARSFIGYIACGIAGESVGDWAACGECHRLIESGDRTLLTARSVATFLIIQPELAEIEDELAVELGTLHSRFFENRLGPAAVIV